MTWLIKKMRVRSIVYRPEGLVPRIELILRNIDSLSISEVRELADYLNLLIQHVNDPRTYKKPEDI